MRHILLNSFAIPVRHLIQKCENRGEDFYIGTGCKFPEQQMKQ
jgi:hypothetical protein